MKEENKNNNHNTDFNKEYISSIEYIIPILQEINELLPEENEDLTDAVNTLSNLKKSIGYVPNIKTAIDGIEKIVNSGLFYKSTLAQASLESPVFVAWAKNVKMHADLLDKTCREAISRSIEETSNKCANFIEGTHLLRKKILIGFLIVVAVLAIVAAIVAIVGLCTKADWADLTASILGTLDFAVGMTGFSIERICDMRAQSFSSSMEQINRIKSADLDRANELRRQLEINIKNSTLGDNSINLAHLIVFGGIHFKY